MYRRTDPSAARAGTAALAVFALAACGDAPVPLERVSAGEAEVTSEGVLVIVVDGLRWDHTSLSGYDRDTTPFLAEFAASGVTFSDVWSPSPELVGSHVAILSGCDPSLARPPDIARLTLSAEAPAADADQPAGTPTADGATGSPDDAWFVPSDLQLLGRPFLGEGWNTAAFVDHPMIAGLRGFDRGFRSFVEFGGDPEEQERTIGVFGVGRRFLTWLNRLDLDENWFAYVHMNDLERVWASRNSSPFAPGIIEATSDWAPRPELQYFPPLGLDEPRFHSLPPSRASRHHPVTLGEYELRYDRGILALDASLARVIGHVDEFGRADNITIVVVGSFGMGLGENGLYLLAGLVEEQDLRVPLVIRPSRRVRERIGWPAAPEGTPIGPGRRRVADVEPRRSDALISLLDVAPTVLDLVGIRAPERVQGLSARALIEELSSGAAPLASDGAGRSVRSAHFASSRVFPGVSVVRREAQFTSYGAAERAPSERESDSGSAPGAQRPPGQLRPPPRPGMPEQAVRRRGAGEQASALTGTLDPGPFRASHDRWRALLVDERRWLHFGVGDADTGRLEEIRALQSSDLKTR